jgi:hypothetical protein
MLAETRIQSQNTPSAICAGSCLTTTDLSPSLSPANYHSTSSSYPPTIAPEVYDGSSQPTRYHTSVLGSDLTLHFSGAQCDEDS